MNQPTVFNFEGTQVRTVIVDNQPMFVGKDVADVLGYSETNAMTRRLDEEDFISTKLTGMNMRSTLINESGLYDAVLGSHEPDAKKFKRWVTHEVLPTIRQQGMYATPETVEKMLSNPDTMIEILTRFKQSQEEVQRLHDENQIMLPKAIFADAVSTSHTTILIGELAKVLRGNGIDIGQNRLFEWLRGSGYLISRKGTDYNAPTQKAMNMGLFKVKETAIDHSNGTVTISKTTKVTGKGQQYFINKFLNDDVLAQ